MKKLLTNIFVAMAFFLTAFWIKQNYEKIEFPKSVEPAFQKEYTPARFCLKKLPFTIVIIGYNNGAFIEKTLESVFSQCYENYKVIYIDDASDDGSFDLAKSTIYESEKLGLVQIVQNETRLGRLENLARAVQSCPEDEIIVILPSEDQFAHEWVLERLNTYYNDPNIWLSVAKGIDFPTYNLCDVSGLEEGKLFGENQLRPNLKTFYASLFKRIREEDLTQSGAFLMQATDLAYMTPMMEMAKNHYIFIDEVLTLNNLQKNMEEDFQERVREEKYIQSLAKYPEIESRPAL